MYPSFVEKTSTMSRHKISSSSRKPCPVLSHSPRNFVKHGNPLRATELSQSGKIEALSLRQNAIPT
ncbi:uncharacterized protein J3R85_016641 [Psidium guajava]|nr:uncharacterized protein J3R85_016641 [Psidium guajava]